MPSVFITLPRRGRIACRARSRPCFADPPAESPSTTNNSLVIEPGLVQSDELARQRDTAGRRAFANDFCLRRATRFARARRQHDARDDGLGDRLVGVQPVLERGTTIPSTADSISGLFSGPWSVLETAAPAGTPRARRSSPSRMSSAVSVTPLGVRLCVSM